MAKCLAYRDSVYRHKRSVVILDRYNAHWALLPATADEQNLLRIRQICLETPSEDDWILITHTLARSWRIAMIWYKGKNGKKKENVRICLPVNCVHAYDESLVQHSFIYAYNRLLEILLEENFLFKKKSLHFKGDRNNNNHIVRLWRTGSLILIRFNCLERVVTLL